MKIEFRNVTFYYKKSEPVLDDLSFVIEDGSMLAIIGHNGSGKSTIAKLIMGLLEPISGEIYINDELLTIDNLDRLRSKMGIIFQNPDNQFVGSTVRDDIAFGLENHLIERSEMERRIEKYSKLVDMELFLDKNCIFVSKDKANNYNKNTYEKESFTFIFIVSIFCCA